MCGLEHLVSFWFYVSLDDKEHSYGLHGSF